MVVRLVDKRSSVQPQHHKNSQQILWGWGDGSASETEEEGPGDLVLASCTGWSVSYRTSGRPCQVRRLMKECTNCWPTHTHQLLAYTHTYLQLACVPVHAHTCPQTYTRNKNIFCEVCDFLEALVQSQVSWVWGWEPSSVVSRELASCTHTAWDLISSTA